jgi:CRP-like cAMP-binding protein
MHPAARAHALHSETRNPDSQAEPRATLNADDLTGSLGRFSKLTPAAIEALAGLHTARTFQKDEWLLRGGDTAKMLFFITRGLVREFYTDAAGAEHTRTFLREGSFTGSLVDLISHRPSITWIQALEPTDTLAIVYSDFARLCDEHPSLQRAARRFAEDLYVRKITREYQLLALSARERYELWIQDWRAIDSRVRRRDLASYLGMRPEYLSRLRSNRAD